MSTKHPKRRRNRHRLRRSEREHARENLAPDERWVQAEYAKMEAKLRKEWWPRRERWDR